MTFQEEQQFRRDVSRITNVVMAKPNAAGAMLIGFLVLLGLCFASIVCYSFDPAGMGHNNDRNQTEESR